jgi:hypothetical protein
VTKRKGGDERVEWIWEERWKLVHPPLRCRKVNGFVVDSFIFAGTVAFISPDV